MLQVPLHSRDQGQGKGRKIETIPATRTSSQGAEVKIMRLVE